jgi:hypothetical protein
VAISDRLDSASSIIANPEARSHYGPLPNSGLNRHDSPTIRVHLSAVASAKVDLCSSGPHAVARRAKVGGSPPLPQNPNRHSAVTQQSS